MDSRAKELIRQGDFLFQKKTSLNTLHQEIAENFYPQRADFTVNRSLGTDFAAGLTTSYPLIAQRELQSQISAMLRPTATEWFHVGVARDERVDNAGREWLEWATKLQYRAMYDRPAQFRKASNEADGDFVAFGQAVMSCELNLKMNSLLYRTWHLRDVAWCENVAGAVDTIHRKWKPTVREQAQYFGKDKLHQQVQQYLDGTKNPYEQTRVNHVVIPADQYQVHSGPDKQWRTKFVSVFVDIENEHIIDEIPTDNPIYIVPRWQTVSGSQYAHSPCTVAALPDARLLQAITLVLLEAGEKAVNPPMIATNDIVRGDINIYAGGVTWVDRDYDERLGESLRPMLQDTSGLPFGLELRDRIEGMIKEAFYLNKLSLPQAQTKEMTAFEVGQRVQEYIRSAMPLFEPMEIDYNGAICEHTFELLMRANAFGSVHDMPQSLRGQDVQFKFESPLHEASERQKGHTFLEAKQLLLQAAELDPRAATMIKATDALRDCLQGNRTPAKWLASEAEMKETGEALAKRQQASADMQQMGQGAAVAEQMGKAAKEVGKASKEVAI